MTTHAPTPTRRPAAAAAASPRTTTIKLVEPARDPRRTAPPRAARKPARAKKALRVIGDGVCFVAWMLCACCVLSGDARPGSNKGYHSYADDDICEAAASPCTVERRASAGAAKAPHKIGRASCRERV